MSFMIRYLRLLTVCSVVIACLAVGVNCHAAGPRYWSATPYQVQIDVIPIGTVFSNSEHLTQVVRRLQEKCDARLQPLWKTKVQAPLPSERKDYRRLLSESLPSAELTSTLLDTAVETLDKDDPLAQKPKDSPPGIDKRILLLIEQQGSSLCIRCREYDTTLKRWGLLYEQSMGRVTEVEESLLNAVTQTFSPLVAFEIDPKDLKLVRVQVRGSDLVGTGSLGIPKPGSILLPFLRRVDREGTPLPDGLSQVAWTYLMVPEAEGDDTEESMEGSSGSVATVFSHTRMPFGARRRGRVQQLAIAVRHDPTLPTKLQLYAQQDESIPLEGYEVFIGLPGKGSELTRLGRTDKTGSILIPESKNILLAHVKSGSTVVASLPIAPGVNPLLRAPLLDERQRLAAEAKLSAMRERLIDLVAQRKILQSRIRRRIEAEDIDTAETLMRELESLPGQAQFSQQLGQAEQFYRADHPLVQRRLDRLFAQTRAVLGSALDAREIRNIKTEVINARQQLGN